MSESLGLHELWPTRLHCPWDFPGNNTGVGCHFLLQGSFPPRDWTWVPCIGRPVLYYWANREALLWAILNNPLKVLVVQFLSHVWVFATPWTAELQASLSITNSQSLLKLMSIESVMPSKHLILCHPLLPQPSIFPSIRVFSNESVLCIRWPKYWSFSSASVLPMNIQDWFP